MKYTVQYCDALMDQELDKLGSDLFTLPIKLMQFRKSTYDYIRETLTYFELTQELSDDIKALIKTRSLPMVRTYGKSNWEVIDPTDYHRLISAEPFIPESIPKIGGLGTGINYITRYKKIRIIKLGQKMSYARDPYKTPTHEYPIVERLSGRIVFDFGVDDGTVYSHAIISYIKEPTFGFDESLMLNEGPLDQSVLLNEIVDLPAISIHKIIDRATNSLRFTSGSQNAAQNFGFDQTFGKRNR